MCVQQLTHGCVQHSQHGNMKKLISCITILLFFSCTKIQEPPTPELCTYEISEDNYQPTARPGKGPKHQRNNYILYIDFDGQTVTSPHWNGGQTINAAPAALTAEQKEQVVNEVAVLFAPYKVTVTDNESLYNSTQAVKRQRIIVTPTSYWFGGVSGVSYIGQMEWGSSTPAWVFSDKLYNTPHFIADITAHEAGHSMASLRHQSVYNEDCTLQLTYRMGAIMGNSLYVPQGSWVYGNTYSCTAWQDDHLMLVNKFGLR